MIYGQRIRQARSLEGLTQKALADRAGVAQPTIAHIETGRVTPSKATLQAIAESTGVHESFFELEPPDDLPPGSLVYRARRSVTAAERDKAHEFARVSIEQIRRMAESLNLPDLNLAAMGEDPAAAARSTRAATGIDQDVPIPHLINAIERNGVIVLGLPIHLEKLDAFSSWATIDVERPVIVVSAGKTGDRLRFSVAHELGHIVLHKQLRGDYAAMEDEANRFAQELLLPERPMREVLSPTFSLTNAARLKLRWGASIQLLVRRARDLGIITDRRYRYLCEQTGALGWRKREPANLDIPVEQPRVFRKMVELTYDPVHGLRKLAAAMRLSYQRAQGILQQYSSGLTNAPIDSTEEYTYTGVTQNLN